MNEPSAGPAGFGPASPPVRRRRVGLAVCAGLTLAAVVAGVIIATRQPHPGGLVATLSGPNGHAACAAAFSPDGTTLAVAGCGDSVSLWDMATRRQLTTLTNPDCPDGDGLTFSSDGKTLAIFSHRAVSPSGRRYHPTTCLWDVAARRKTTLTDPPLLSDDFTLGAFSPYGTTLAVADNSGNIYLWDLAAKRLTATVTASSYCVGPCRVAFSPDGSMLVVGAGFPRSSQPQVYLWDLAARRWVGTLTEPGGTIEALAFGRNGILAVGADDDHVYLWNVAARRLADVIAPPIDEAAGNDSISKDGTPYPAAGNYDKSTVVAFSPDGTMLAIGASFGYGTYLYDVSAGKRVATLTDPGGRSLPAPAAAFSPDGMLMTATDGNGRTYVWDVTRIRRHVSRHASA